MDFKNLKTNLKLMKRYVNQNDKKKFESQVFHRVGLLCQSNIFLRKAFKIKFVHLPPTQNMSWSSLISFLGEQRMTKNDLFEVFPDSTFADNKIR